MASVEYVHAQMPKKKKRAFSAKKESKNSTNTNNSKSNSNMRKKNNNWTAKSTAWVRLTSGKGMKELPNTPFLFFPFSSLGSCSTWVSTWGVCVCVCILCGRVFRMVDRKRRYGRDLDSLDTLGVSAKKKRRGKTIQKKTENCFEKKKGCSRKKRKRYNARLFERRCSCLRVGFFSPKLMTGQMPKRMRRDERRRRTSNGREKTYKWYERKNNNNKDDERLPLKTA